MHVDYTSSGATARFQANPQRVARDAREQAPPRSSFFNTNNYKKLALIMKKNWNNYNIKIEKKNHTKATSDNIINLNKYYYEWYKIVEKELSI